MFKHILNNTFTVKAHFSYFPFKTAIHKYILNQNFLYNIKHKNIQGSQNQRIITFSFHINMRVLHWSELKFKILSFLITFGSYSTFVAIDANITLWPIRFQFVNRKKP